MRVRKVVALAAGVLVVMASTGSASDGIFATTPADDRPEGVLVDGDTVFVTTTIGAEGAAGGLDPSVIHLFDRRTGRSTGQIVVAGERVVGPFVAVGPQGVAGMAQDQSGRLYAADAQGRILRFTRADGGFTQDTYATVPDLRSCLIAPAPCSAAADDRVPFVNEIDFGPDGTLFVTDSFQATVFRVPRGGGVARVHVTDRRLGGAIVGANGIAVAPDGRSLVVAVSQSDPMTSTIYRTGLVAGSALTAVAVLEGAAADGLVFGLSGRLYVALPERNAVGVLLADGTLERVLPVPHADEPAGLAFLGADLLVANHAFGTLDAAPRVVSRMPAGERGSRRFRPRID